MAPGNDNIDGNGWNEYEKLVMSELKRVAKNTEDIRRDTEKSNLQFVSLISNVELRVLNKISIINAEIATLKVKAGLWGSLGGICAILMAFCVWLVKQSWAETLTP